MSGTCCCRQSCRELCTPSELRHRVKATCLERLPASAFQPLLVSRLQVSSHFLRSEHGHRVTVSRPESELPPLLPATALRLYTPGQVLGSLFLGGALLEDFQLIYNSCLCTNETGLQPYPTFLLKFGYYFSLLNISHTKNTYSAPVTSIHGPAKQRQHYEQSCTCLHPLDSLPAFLQGSLLAGTWGCSVPRKVCVPLLVDTSSLQY